MTYPETPGYQKTSQTSRSAATAAIPSAKKQGKLLFEWILSRGREGATIDEGIEYLASVYGIPKQASPRFRQLELGGLIAKTAETRKTREGLDAVVYIVRKDNYEPDAQPTKGGISKGVTGEDRYKRALERALDHMLREGYGKQHTPAVKIMQEALTDLT